MIERAATPGPSPTRTTVKPRPVSRLEGSKLINQLDKSRIFLSTEIRILRVLWSKTLGPGKKYGQDDLSALIIRETQERLAAACGYQGKHTTRVFRRLLQRLLDSKLGVLRCEKEIKRGRRASRINTYTIHLEGVRDLFEGETAITPQEAKELIQGRRDHQTVARTRRRVLARFEEKVRTANTFELVDMAVNWQAQQPVVA